MRQVLLTARRKWTLVLVALSVLTLVAILVGFAVGGVHLGTEISTATSLPATAGIVFIAFYDFWGACYQLIKRVARASQPGKRCFSLSVRSLTSLAALLAGTDGPALLEESDDHLAGWDGHDPLSWQKVKQATAFVKAGGEYRCLNITEAAWQPVDAVLRSRFLSTLFVVIPTIVDAVVVLQFRGPVQVLISFSSIFGAGTALSLAIKAGRKYREIEPPKPKAHGAGK